MLQPRSVAALTQPLLLAENRRDRFHDLDSLLATHKGIQPHGQVRFLRKSAAHPNEKPSSAPRRAGDSPTSLISGYEHHEPQPVTEILNLRGRL